MTAETRPTYPGPHVFTKEQIHDFGSVKAGEVVHHTFLISNYGDQPLTLKPARQDCGCVAFIGPSTTVAANEDGWIELSLDTAGPPGVRSRAAVLETNDPAHPQLTLTLIGKAGADVIANPPVLFFGRLPTGVVLTKSVQVTAAEGTTITTVASSQSTNLSLAVERLAAPANGVRINVTLHTPLASGRFVAALRVKSTSQHQPELEIPVLASIE